MATTMFSRGPAAAPAATWNSRKYVCSEPSLASPATSESSDSVSDEEMVVSQEAVKTIDCLHDRTRMERISLLEEETSILNQIVHNMRTSMRNDRGFRSLLKTSKCNRRIVKACRALAKASSATPRPKALLDLLQRLVGIATLARHTAAIASSAFSDCLQQLKFTSQFSYYLTCLAALSRVWILLKATEDDLVQFYYALFPFSNAKTSEQTSLPLSLGQSMMPANPATATAAPPQPLETPTALFTANWETEEDLGEPVDDATGDLRPREISKAKPEPAKRKLPTGGHKAIRKKRRKKKNVVETERYAACPVQEREGSKLMACPVQEREGSKLMACPVQERGGSKLMQSSLGSSPKEHQRGHPNRTSPKKKQCGHPNRTSLKEKQRGHPNSCEIEDIFAGLD